jgi:colicin import membrane protein
MSTAIESRRKVTPPPPDDPWYYGFRDVIRTLPDGTTKHERIPLTLEDTLHPQEGDCIMESDVHEISLTYLASVFRWRTADDPEALILSDTGVYWDNPDLPYTHHSPDISVIFGIKNRKPIYTSFHVREEGVRPALIIEVVSQNNRENDVDTKVHDYHENEVPTYVVADRKGLTDPWTLIAYCWRPDDYVQIPPDARGRIWLDDLDLWLGADGTRLVCYERDGTEIGDYTATARQAEAEKQRAEAEKHRADSEKQRAEAAVAKAKELEAELARLRGQ